jgi:hypothetical protein
MVRVSAAIVGLFFTITAYAKSTYPLNPNPSLTPGSYCQHPNSYRYPEHIPYCERNVPRERKQEAIRQYNQKLGYDIRPGDRSQFKIDHLIPLCAGGSNELENLWPQHKNVYQITDPLEQVACEKMAAGRLRQARAVEMLMRAKNHLDEAPRILSELEAL